MEKIYCLDSSEDQNKVKIYETKVGVVNHRVMKYNCIAKTGHNTDVNLEFVDFYSQNCSRSLVYLQINPYDSQTLEKTSDTIKETV